jgi:hypothetical protein
MAGASPHALATFSSTELLVHVSVPRERKPVPLEVRAPASLYPSATAAKFTPRNAIANAHLAPSSVAGNV